MKIENIEIEKIKKVLKKEKISYDELSRLSNVPLNTLKNIFSGKTPHPRIDTVQAIERALGLTPEPTDEEKALGLTRTAPIALADKDRRRLTMLMEADDVLGEKTVDSMLKMIELAVESKKNS